VKRCPPGCPSYLPPVAAGADRARDDTKRRAFWAMTVPEADAAADEAVRTEGRLCVWRIFGVTRAFTDRQSDRGWSASSAGPVPDSAISVTIGEVPEDVAEAIRFGRVISLFALETMFGNEHAAKSMEEREAYAAEALERQDLSEVIRGTYPTWITVELSRSEPMMVRPDFRHLWASDHEAMLRSMRAFEADAATALDLATARLLPALGDRLQPAKLAFRRLSAYALVPGRPGFSVPALSGGVGYAQVAGKGWDDLPFDAVEAAITGSSRFPARDKNLLEHPARWLWAALAETDNLRRFLFAFLGLEVLANKASKALKQVVAANLEQELGFPVEQLLWPSPKEADSPWRNLAFNFAISAVHLARSSAGPDIDKFQELARVRNGLAHGRWNSGDEDKLPAWEAIELLMRYVALLAEAESAGRLP